MFASAKLRIVMLFVGLTVAGSVSEAMAWTKTQEGLGLGTSAIQNPIQPESSEDAWKGSYVYYGRYHTDEARLTPLVPVKYRVLDKESSAFGVDGGSLFLDCDKILYKAPFDRSGNRTNVWDECTERDFLNGGRLAYDGKVFYGRDGVFSDAEDDAIAISKWSRPSDAQNINNMVPTALNGDRIFFLDITDAENTAYGYGSDGARRKVFVFPIDKDWHSWWLRSPIQNENKAVRVRTEGTYFIESNVYKQDYVGASPAFNVKLSSILFSSLVNGEAEKPGAEYKLTLKDADMGITADTVTRNGNTVTVYYTISGEHAGSATRVSVLVTDGTWDKDSGWSDGAEVKLYDTLSGSFSTSGGWGIFELDGTWGTDYNIYILAEDVNGENETDYAGEPMLINIPAASGSSNGNNDDGLGSGGNGQKNSGVENGSGVQGSSENGLNSYGLDKAAGNDSSARKNNGTENSNGVQGSDENEPESNSLEDSNEATGTGSQGSGNGGSGGGGCSAGFGGIAPLGLIGILMAARKGGKR